VSAGAFLRIFGGLAAGLAVVILFVIFDPQQWLLIFTLGVVPTAGVLAYGRANNWPTANLVAMPTLVVGSALGAFLKGPISTYPQTWIIFLWTLGVPVAAYFGYRAFEWGGRERGLAVAGAVLAAGVAGAFGAPALWGVASEIGTLFALTLAVPTGWYVYRVLSTRDEGAVGLLMPVVFFGGMLLGAFVVQNVWTVAQPDPWLDWAYLTNPPSQLFPEEAGLYPAIIGSVFVITNVAILTLALGVGTAIYLEEYAPTSGLLGRTTRVIQVNISNLAGVPSVVYGLLGLGLFVNLLGMGIGIVLVASMTLALLILPIVIISAQEAIRAVSPDLRQASYGMGATKWQTVRNVVLPQALPGILTGTILALGRAIGEAAPLLMIGVATTTFSTPTGYFDSVSAMPLQIYAWSTMPDPAFRYGVVAAGVVTLLIVLLTMNSIAILIRNKYQKEV
jgi:phosphate transport system permease protein